MVDKNNAKSLSLADMVAARSYLQFKLIDFEKAAAATLGMYRIQRLEQSLNHYRYYKNCVSCVKKLIHDANVSIARMEKLRDESLGSTV